MAGKSNDLASQLSMMAQQFQAWSNQYAKDQEENVKKFDSLTRNSSMLNQKNYEKDVVISGLPSGFEEHIIAENFLKFYGFSALHMNCFFKFYKNDNDGNKKELLVVSFVHLFAKQRIMNELKNSGPLFWRDLGLPDDTYKIVQAEVTKEDGSIELVPQKEGRKVRISNRLTRINLRIDRKLMELKREHKIKGFRFRKGFYEFEFLNGRWVTVYNVKDILAFFPSPATAGARKKPFVGNRNKGKGQKSVNRLPGQPHMQSENVEEEMELEEDAQETQLEQQSLN